MVGSFKSSRAAVKAKIRFLIMKTRDKRHTLDLRNLIIDNLPELALGDTIAEEDDPLGEGLVAIDTSFDLVVDVHTNTVLNIMHQSSESLQASGMDIKQCTHLHHFLCIINNLPSALLHL